VRNDEAGLIKQYKITSFPTFVLLRNEFAPLKYDGASYTYSELFEFVNTYSETFVIPGADMTAEPKVSAAAKAWLNTPVPFLSKDSGNDICLKKDGTLCVVYVVKEASQSDPKIVSTMQALKDAFSSKIERGITFSFVRLDASAEKDFFGMFEMSTEELPAVVVVNPGKRKRYLKHDKDLSVGGLSETLDTILGGDARFKAIKDFASLNTQFE
jgi:hypothetical protein